MTSDIYSITISHGKHFSWVCWIDMDLHLHERGPLTHDEAELLAVCLETCVKGNAHERKVTQQP